MVALTGWGAESDRTRTSEAGFRHHLVKPIEPEKLRAVLEGIPCERNATESQTAVKTLAGPSAPVRAERSA